MCNDRVCPRAETWEVALVVETWAGLDPVAGIWVEQDPEVVATLAEHGRELETLGPAMLGERAPGKVAVAGLNPAAFRRTSIVRKAIGPHWVTCRLLARDPEQADRARILIDRNYLVLVEAADQTLATTQILGQRDPADHQRCQELVLVLVEELPVERRTIF
jgi:hypothetical protein